MNSNSNSNNNNNNANISVSMPANNIHNKFSSGAAYSAPAPPSKDHSSRSFFTSHSQGQSTPNCMSLALRQLTQCCSIFARWYYSQDFLQNICDVYTTYIVLLGFINTYAVHTSGAYVDPCASFSSIKSSTNKHSSAETAVVVDGAATVTTSDNTAANTSTASGPISRFSSSTTAAAPAPTSSATARTTTTCTHTCRHTCTVCYA